MASTPELAADAVDGRADLLSRWGSRLLAVLGGVSLIDDARAFRSNLADWIAVWNDLVASVTGFVFGWIDWLWLGVTTNEAHLFTLWTAILGARYRVGRRINQARKLDPINDAFRVFGFYVGVIVLPLVLLITFPFRVLVASTIALLILIVVAAGILARREDEERRPSAPGRWDGGDWDDYHLPSGRQTAVELAKIGSVLAALVLLDVMLAG